MKLNIKKGAGIALMAVALLGGTTVNAQLSDRNSIKLQAEDGELFNQVDATTLTEANFIVIPPDWAVYLEMRAFTPMTGAEGGYLRYVNDGAKSVHTIEVEEAGTYQMSVRYAYGVGELPFLDDGAGTITYFPGQMGTQVLWPEGGGTGEVFKDDEGNLLDDGLFPGTVEEEGTWKTITWDKFIEFKEGTNTIEVWKFWSNASLDYIVIGDLAFLSTEDQDMNAFNLYPNP
ncbi:MAG: hypothetical protein KAG37_00395, partial [Flavobacteriales bacterium]|nr:hypothetical protein [Flavobacteriales bacterium]